MAKATQARSAEPKRRFFVRAVWDADAKVYYSESDIRGLHIEAATLDAFEEVLADTAPDLIVANHLSKADLASTSLTDLIPTIVWERPAPRDARRGFEPPYFASPIPRSHSTMAEKSRPPWPWPAKSA